MHVVQAHFARLEIAPAHFVSTRPCEGKHHFDHGFLPRCSLMSLRIAEPCVLSLRLVKAIYLFILRHITTTDPVKRYTTMQPARYNPQSNYKPDIEMLYLLRSPSELSLPIHVRVRRHLGIYHRPSALQLRGQFSQLHTRQQCVYT
jgi:hypothetical protein